MDDPTSDPAQLLTAWMRAGQEAMQYFNLPLGAGAPSESGASAHDRADPAAQFIANVTTVAELQREAFKNITDFWTHFASPPGTDGVVRNA